jgi:hypothetical protein
MTTITEIRDQLVEVFNGLRTGTVEPKDAVEINNTAGKIISTAKVQIAYHALRGEAPNIPFLAAPVDGPAGRAAIGGQGLEPA